MDVLGYELKAPSSRSKEELDKIKTEYANEFGLKFNDEYKGNKSARSNGHIGGPIGGNKTKMMIEEFKRKWVEK